MGWLGYFIVKLNSIFSLTIFSSGAKHAPECKMFSDFGLLLKQTQPKSCPIYNYYYHHCYISISLGKISE